MKLSYFTKQLSMLSRWLLTTAFCLCAIAFVWQSALPSNSIAMAAPTSNLIAAADPVDQAKDKYMEESGRSKNFIEDTKEAVQRTAKRNAERVDQATDDGSPVEGKAKRDAARIEKRAEEDASRTQKAVDSARNAVERTADSIKDVFSN